MFDEFFVYAISMYHSSTVHVIDGECVESINLQRGSLKGISMKFLGNAVEAVVVNSIILLGNNTLFSISVSSLLFPTTRASQLLMGYQLQVQYLLQ